MMHHDGNGRSTRVDVQVQASLPSLALPSSQQGQALAARILPLPSEKIEITILGFKCNQIILTKTTSNKKIKVLNNTKIFTMKTKFFK